MWSPAEEILRMLPSATKLIVQLAKDGISFEPDDGELHNVVFRQGDKVVKMSHHSFYRFSGIAVITRDKKGENNQSETVPVTDDQYLQVFIKPIIYTLLSV